MRYHRVPHGARDRPLSDYADILRRVAQANFEAGGHILNMGGELSNTSQRADTLTTAKLREVQRMLEDYVRPDAFDIYGHDLPDQDRCFIIDRRKVHDGLFKDSKWSWMSKVLEGPDIDRKLLIVPRPRLEATYQALRAQGVDVRLEPRYGAPAAPEDGP